MEFIKRAELFELAVAGVVIVTLTWVLVVLGTFLFRRRRRPRTADFEEALERIERQHSPLSEGTDKRQAAEGVSTPHGEEAAREGVSTSHGG